MKTLDQMPAWETLLTYASMLEKPQYWIDPKTGRRHKLATGEIVEAACDALRVCARIKIGKSDASSAPMEDRVSLKPKTKPATLPSWPSL